MWCFAGEKYLGCGKIYFLFGLLMRTFDEVTVLCAVKFSITRLVTKMLKNKDKSSAILDIPKYPYGHKQGKFLSAQTLAVKRSGYLLNVASKLSQNQFIINFPILFIISFIVFLE